MASIVDRDRFSEASYESSISSKRFKAGDEGSIKVKYDMTD
jgi:hypothetical protein